MRFNKDWRTARSLTAISALFLSGSAFAAEHVVTQQGVSFVPASVDAYPGDTIRWVYTGGTHSVTSGVDCTPSGLFDSPLSIKNTEFVWTVPATAAGTTIDYYCDPHCIFGQLGTIRVGTEHVVTQQGFAFVPATVVAAPGDRIRWVRTGGNHTVTSGAKCTSDGTHFDGVLSLAAPEFSWIVPQSAAGATIPYFCAPHCFFDMVGSITVTGNANPADVNGDGSVNAADLAEVLNSWGATGGAADVDGSGSVNAADLAMVLSAWTG